MTYGAGRRVLAAGNVLLALLVDQVLDGNTDDGDCGWLAYCSTADGGSTYSGGPAWSTGRTDPDR